MRFDGVKAGDQIMRRESIIYHNKGTSQATTYSLVTDLWFDPVKGQRSAERGEMVAIQQISVNGELCGSKYAHTRRGLASNGYDWADLDYITLAKERQKAHQTGKVIGIGDKRRPPVRPRPL